MILDSIAMRLQIIGENIKDIYKIEPEQLKKFSHIEWDNIMRMRDIISNHYDMLDHEIIYDICKNHIPILKDAIKKMLG